MMFLRNPSWRVFLVVLAAGLAWAASTGQEWEDYYITYRASKNLAEGHGLVFTVGQRVHSFTSPLGVLLPAASYLLTGRSSDVAALWIFRLLSLGALGGAAVVMWRTLRQLCPATAAPAGFFVTMLAADSKTICFSTSGMETAFLLLFLAWSLHALFLRPPRIALHLGLAWAGLMWTRPDSCVYIAALTAGFLLFAPNEGGYLHSRMQGLRPIGGAAALCAALYLPWVVWAWSYYGTPVPHTITAKGLFNDASLPALAKALVHFPQTILAGKSSLTSTFMPYHGGRPDWAAAAGPVSFALTLIAVVMAFLPAIRWEARLTSLACLVGHFYLTAVVGYPVPWYLPHVTFLCITTLSLGLGQALTLAEKWHAAGSGAGRWLGRLSRIVALALALGTASLTVAMARQAYLEMTIIERDVRGAIGKWLHATAARNDETVFLEPLGFIGFFSGLKMLDYPGLGSPEVVAARRHASTHAYPDCLGELIASLRPDWVILRPFERAEVERRDPVLLSQLYERVRIFDASAQIEQARFVPIRGYLDFNGRFEVFHLKPGWKARPHPEIPLLVAIPLDQFHEKQSPLPIEFVGSNLKAHAPSRLTVSVPVGASQLVGGFGIYEGAYAKPRPEATDGAEFVIEHVSADGRRTVVFRRFLDPSAQRGDRGLQGLNVELPSEPGQLEFIVNPGPAHSNAYDWSYWYDLRFGVPAR